MKNKEGVHEFSLFFDGGFSFCFLSPTAFRLYEAKEHPNFAYAWIRPYEGEVLHRKEGFSDVFVCGKTKVYVRPDYSLIAYFDGQEVLRQTPLLEKEGKHSFRLLHSGPVYGLGDKAGPLDKRGYSFENWNSDIPDAHVETMPSLYKGVPFFLMFQPSRTVGVLLDNPGRTTFDFGKKHPGVIEVGYQTGCYDVAYFFGSLPEVVSAYTARTGRSQLPPRWALGHQQSRWSYGSKEDADKVIASYGALGIPLSALYLDIAYMDSYKDFSVDPKAFPDIEKWIKEKNKQGVRIIPIIDAGVKAEEGYSVYDEGIAHDLFCTQDGEVYHNEVWPGDSVFPAFGKEETVEWWKGNVSRFLKRGFSGIWNDMNEPASFRGPIPDGVDMGGYSHEEFHNAYSHRMNEATYRAFVENKKRPYIVTRSAYAGTQRYAATWTGDNQSIYDHVRLMIPQMCSLSLSGFGDAGADLGGFGGDATGELLLRFLGAGLFNPLFRNHCAFSGRPQEGYAFDEAVASAYKELVLTRYEILPTLYDWLYRQEAYGEPAVRPLVYEFPDDSLTWNENTELMLGDSLLLAPALFPGQNHRSVYFPDDFYAFDSGEHYPKGPALIETPLDRANLFVRAHSLIPLNPSSHRDTDYPSCLRLLWTGDEAEAVHYEDEGDGLSYHEGAYNLFAIKADPEKGVSIRYLHHGMETHYRYIQVDALGQGSHLLPFEPKEVGEEVEEEETEEVEEAESDEEE